MLRSSRLEIICTIDLSGILLVGTCFIIQGFFPVSGFSLFACVVRMSNYGLGVHLSLTCM